MRLYQFIAIFPYRPQAKLLWMAEDGCPAHMQLLEFCQSGNIHCISSEQSKEHIVIGNQSRTESVLQAGEFVFLSSILIYFGKSSNLKQDVKKDIFQIQEISFNFQWSTISKLKSVPLQRRILFTVSLSHLKFNGLWVGKQIAYNMY